jgi:hypothetical protein
MIMSKAKRNDIIAIESRHTSTDIKMKKHEYVSYFLAKAVKVNRQGIVVEYQKPDMGYAYTLDKGQRVLTIADPMKQAAARELFATIKENYFPDTQSLREAILDREMALS